MRSVPLFEKDDCMGRDLLLDNRSLRCPTSCIPAVVQSLHSRHPWRSCRRYEPKEGRGRSRREHAIEGNATTGVVYGQSDCRGAGGDFLINPPRSPFFKGGSERLLTFISAYPYPTDFGKLFGAKSLLEPSHVYNDKCSTREPFAEVISDEILNGIALIPQAALFGFRLVAAAALGAACFFGAKDFFNRRQPITTELAPSTSPNEIHTNIQTSHKGR
jgi:hypothetical protein